MTGVDSSVAMLREARRQVPGIRFVAADVHRLPFPDGSADLVTCALALTHVADLRPVLAELARVLRPGGTAIVSDVHPELVRRGSAVKSVGPTGRPQLAATHVHPIGDHLRAALAAGFTVRRCEELPRPAGPGAVGDPPSAQPVREIGEWRDWPWTLLAWVPEATRTAWDNPAVVVWHLVLGPPSVRRGRP